MQAGIVIKKTGEALTTPVNGSRDNDRCIACLILGACTKSTISINLNYYFAS
jgi:hypothetical protein